MLTLVHKDSEQQKASAMMHIFIEIKNMIAVNSGNKQL